MVSEETRAAYNVAHMGLEDFYLHLAKWGLLLFGLTIVMGVVTINTPFPWSAWNTLFFFLGVMIAFFVGFQPKVLSFAALVGWLVQGGSLSGAGQAIRVQQRIIFTICIVWGNVVLLNSIVPFHGADDIPLWLLTHMFLLLIGLAGVRIGKDDALHKFTLGFNIILLVLGIGYATWPFVFGTAADKEKGGANVTQTHLQTAKDAGLSVDEKNIKVMYPLVDHQCDGKFAKMKDCRKVTLRGDAVFPYQADVGYRPRWNPQEVVNVTDYGMGSIEVKSKRGNLVTVSVFQTPL